MSARDRVACEDVLMFVNAAISSTGQREFHSSADEQQVSLRFLHEYLLGNYRELYAATLALDINHHNAAMIMVNLLSDAGTLSAEQPHSAERQLWAEQRAIEGRLIAARLRLLPPQRVYRIFRQLRNLGINNRRTRAIIRDWVAARPDPAFDAVKYRRSLSIAARHVHLPLPTEVGTALFDWRRPKRYDTPILEAWRRAHYEQRALYDLPYTVAEGLAAQQGVPRERFLTRMAPKLTAGERLRLQDSAQRLKADGIAMDLAAAPLTKLALYVLTLPRPERAQRREELTTALRAAARRAAGRQTGTWGRVVAVLDDSYSSSGSGVKGRRPMAVALGTHYLLESLASEYTGLWLTHRGDPLLVHPIGATPLGDRILDALERRPERLIIVSDGWDNAPPGQAAEVLRVWRTRLDPAGHTDIVHLNPVYDSGGFDVRRLSPVAPTVGVRDAEDAASLVEFARFAVGSVHFDNLRRYLTDRVRRFLEEAS